MLGPIQSDMFAVLVRRAGVRGEGCWNDELDDESRMPDSRETDPSLYTPSSFAALVDIGRGETRPWSQSSSDARAVIVLRRQRGPAALRWILG